MPPSWASLRHSILKATIAPAAITGVPITISSLRYRPLLTLPSTLWALQVVASSLSFSV